MNILYISQTNIDLNKYSIYSDLSNALINNNDQLTIVCANSNIKKTTLEINDKCKILRVKVANQFGVSIIKKAFIIMTLENVFKRAIKKYLADQKYDLIIYTTPPITFSGVIKYCKKKYMCKSYLMLKDIFPQNAVDLKMLKKTGLKGFIYKYFRKKEIALYNVSDKIGCMSQMNIDYVLKQNPYLDKDKVEYFPNSAIIKPLKNINKEQIINKYSLDKNKINIIYGGNLGKPQGLAFFEKCLHKCGDLTDVQFIVIGRGSEKEKLYNNIKNIKNVITLNALPPEDYDDLCQACDIGLVLLDKNFTIPNYPSRMLSYMSSSIPMFACIDKNNDVPDLLKNAKCGISCYSEDVDDFYNSILWIIENKSKLIQMGINGRKYFEENFNVEKYICNFEKLLEEKNK